MDKDKEVTYDINGEQGTFTISDYSDHYGQNITVSTTEFDPHTMTENFDPQNITLDWDFGSSNNKVIDLDLLEKYPTAKTLYNQFISVYTMCEEEDKLNEENL